MHSVTMDVSRCEHCILMCSRVQIMIRAVNMGEIFDKCPIGCKAD